MKLKYVIFHFIILSYSLQITSTTIIINNANKILQCTAKIYATFTEKRIILISKINENLDDFNTIENSNGLMIYTKDTFYAINRFGGFHVFIILINTITQYEQLIQKLSKTNIWDSRGKFLIAYFGNEDIGPIFNKSWSNQIYNINVIKQDNSETSVYTFYPYEGKNCGKYYGYSLLSSCEENITKDVFPNKIPLQFPGCEVKAMAYVIPPYVINLKMPREESGKTGIEVTIIHNVARRMNISLNFVPNPHRHWGYRYSDGSVTLMYKALKDGQVDIIFGFMYGNSTYSDDFDASYCHLGDASIWFFPTAPEMAQWKNMSNIFEPNLWLAILIMLLINGIAWYIIGRNRETSDDFNDLVICIMHSMYLLLQGSVDCPRTWKIRLIFFLWLITCLLIFTAHQSQLVSILTSTLYERQMKTLEELLASKSEFGFYPTIEDAYRDNTSLNVAILKQYQECPLTAECLNRTAFKRDFAVVKNRRQVLYLMPRYYTFPNGRAMLFDTDIACFTTKERYYMNKGFPLVDRINDLLMLMQENGLISKWDFDTRFYVLKLESDSGTEPLTLEHLQGGFFILVFGISFAIFAFVCERVIGKGRKPPRTKL